LSDKSKPLSIVSARQISRITERVTFASTSSDLSGLNQLQWSNLLEAGEATMAIFSIIDG
jgi:hypothetical protein